MRGSGRLRQRVQRACLECRARKVKCDGRDTCARCLSHDILCQYCSTAIIPGGGSGQTLSISNHGRPQNAIASHDQAVRSLESKVLSLTQLVSRLVSQADQQPGTTSNRECSPQALGDQAAVGIFDGQQQSTGAHIPTQRVDKDSSNAQLELQDDIAELLRDLTGQTLHEAPAHSTTDSGSHSFGPTQPFHMSSNAERTQSVETGQRHYSDNLGELSIDNDGTHSYIGLGSTAWVAIESCVGLRRHITERLTDRGLCISDGSPHTPRLESDLTGDSGYHQVLTNNPLSPSLVDHLCTAFITELIQMYPFIQEDDLWKTSREMTTAASGTEPVARCEQANSVICIAALAAATTVAGPMARYSMQDVGNVFYTQAAAYLDRSRGKRRQGLDHIAIMALLTVYLAGTGAQSEAWLLVGDAIRLGQAAGLHRSPAKLTLPRRQWNERKSIWWGLYILERQLCIALGRPLTIRDEDCDVEKMASEPGVVREWEFLTNMIDLYRIIGPILTKMSAVDTPDVWHDDEQKKSKLQDHVSEASQALQKWACRVLPTHTQCTASSSDYTHRMQLAQHHLYLSSLFSAVLLLYRSFIRNPHRSSPLAGSSASFRSAKAASDCIDTASDFFSRIPRGPSAIFHGQHVFASALILLSCIRWSDNHNSVLSGLRTVERAMGVLHTMRDTWSRAEICCAIVEEYLQFSFRVIGGDRRCHFGCEDDARKEDRQPACQRDWPDESSNQYRSSQEPRGENLKRSWANHRGECLAIPSKVPRLER